MKKYIGFSMEFSGRGWSPGTYPTRTLKRAGGFCFWSVSHDLFCLHASPEHYHSSLSVL